RGREVRHATATGGLPPRGLRHARQGHRLRAQPGRRCRGEPGLGRPAMGDLDGKLALVTGGGKGVGKVVAHELAARGAHILLNFFHSLDQAKETKAELEAAGATVDMFRASVAQPAQVAKMFAEIEERFGYLD